MCLLKMVARVFRIHTTTVILLHTASNISFIFEDFNFKSASHNGFSRLFINSQFLHYIDTQCNVIKGIRVHPSKSDQNIMTHTAEELKKWLATDVSSLTSPLLYICSEEQYAAHYTVYTGAVWSV